ncbi:MAG: hypothetical protein WC760_10110 [Bacteroidia bacterium]
MIWISGYRFILHYLISTPIDVLHSPFVFQLYNACIRRQKVLPAEKAATFGPEPEELQPYSKRTLQILQHLMLHLNLRRGTVITDHNVQKDSPFNIPDLLDVVMMQIEDERLAYTGFERILNKLHNNSVIIFHNMYASKAKYGLWQKIKQHPQVTVTVDVFFLGLVFFRKEQVRQDFRIRLF